LDSVGVSVTQRSQRSTLEAPVPSFGIWLGLAWDVLGFGLGDAWVMLG